MTTILSLQQCSTQLSERVCLVAMTLNGYEIKQLYKCNHTLFTITPEGLNNLVQAVNRHNATYQLAIIASKTKIMELDKFQENANICIDVSNVWAQCLPQMETVIPT